MMPVPPPRPNAKPFPKSLAKILLMRNPTHPRLRERSTMMNPSSARTSKSFRRLELSTGDVPPAVDSRTMSAFTPIRGGDRPLILVEDRSLPPMSFCVQVSLLECCDWVMSCIWQYLTSRPLFPLCAIRPCLQPIATNQPTLPKVSELGHIQTTTGPTVTEDRGHSMTVTFVMCLSIPVTIPIL